MFPSLRCPLPSGTSERRDGSNPIRYLEISTGCPVGEFPRSAHEFYTSEFALREPTGKRDETGKKITKKGKSFCRGAHDEDLLFMMGRAVERVNGCDISALILEFPGGHWAPNGVWPVDFRSHTTYYMKGVRERIAHLRDQGDPYFLPNPPPSMKDRMVRYVLEQLMRIPSELSEEQREQYITALDDELNRLHKVASEGFA